jgi:mannose-6-phosphate isomerase
VSYSLVTEAQLGEVFALYQSAVENMHARGLYQWEWGEYPSEEILREDVRLRRLYRLDTDEGLTAVFAVCVGQDREYEDVPWQFGVNPVCLHRIAVRPDRQGKGHARAILDFVKEEGRRLGCDCLRLDTCVDNEKALRLFASATVREAGTFRIAYRPHEFHCFEAPLTEESPLLPIRMHPAYRSGALTPWGGDGLKTLFGKEIPDERTGEALEVSCIPGLESTDDAGEKLPALIARSGAALAGEENVKTFPLLLKLLNAKSKLSVQVHPNDDYALKHEHKLGKTEAWVILHAEEGATLSYGFKEGVTKEALAEALNHGGDVEPLLATVRVSAGDVLYMPSGMAHAIGGGVTLYEIQQSSDVTYRLWDYNRTDAQGNKRELHVKQALDVVNPSLRGLRTRLPDTPTPGLHMVLAVPAFTLSCLCVAGEQALAGHARGFRIFTALGPLTVRWQGGRLALRAGETALIPARSPEMTVAGEGRALIAGMP